MPRYPAQGQPKRAFVTVEFHPEIKKYLVDLGDDTGVSPPKIVRLCVERALPEIEALLRSGEDPPDRLNRARAGKEIGEPEPMKYRPRQVDLPPQLIDEVLKGDQPDEASPEAESSGSCDVPSEELTDPTDVGEPQPPAPPVPPVAPKRRRRG